VVVLGEYRYGIGQSRYRRSYQAWLDEALEDLQIVPVMDATAREYSRVLLELRRAGTPIPTNDAWVAALCREHRLPLVSRDAHFDVVPGLRRIAW
jgi:predicted nucleic acid-binding protein